ncbi:MAG: hypothetical protein CMF45_04475 [Legionellales bacterium]|nr:hypothetical protein [Legionellales bacterium]
MEKTIEKTLFASRWLLTPIYLGLSLSLILLAIKFFQELFHVFSIVISISESDLVLSILSMIDMTLVGSLIVMVMFSSYENFVSKIDLDEDDEKLDWLGKLDAGTLKLKVAASIVAISSIHLLQLFMKIDELNNDKLMWYVIFHMTFVLSALLLAVLDKIAFSEHREN